MIVKSCLIPAAGEGLRARPQTAEIPKGMLRVGGKPILQNSIELVRDQLDITKFVIVTGHFGKVIQDYFRDGHWLNVDIRYIENDAIDKGLTWSIYLARHFMDARFLVVLGDEFYQHSNHYVLKDMCFRGTIATCGVIKTDDHDMIRQNYLVSCADNRIVRLIEKPQAINGDLMGTGTFVLSEKIFPMIGERYDHSISGIGFIDLLDEVCGQGYHVSAFELKGSYVNINDLAALDRANKLYSSRG